MATKKTIKRKPAKKTKAAAKDVGGRPTKYTAAMNEQARKLALLGLTDRELADFFNIGEATLHRWKNEHEGFRESVSAGKQRADAEIAASLYQTALGGSVVTEIREEPDEDGGLVIKQRVVRELPADVRAQRYWLGNRNPALWRDKVVVENETPPETLAATVNRYVEIMARSRERQRQVLIERGLLPDGEA